MKLLHTSDWHVGRGARGRDRIDEHEQVLKSIVTAAREHDVDAVIVAGDQFDKATPTPASERLVYQALAALGKVAPTFVIGGNHDNTRRLEAIRHLLALTGVHAFGRYRPASNGGTVKVTTDGGDLAIAALPWIPYRRSLDVAQVLDPKQSAADYGLSYAELITSAVDDLCSTMDDSTINIAVAHLSIMGAAMGGGERDAHCTITYHVPASAFGPTLDYVALGHFHRPQTPQGSGPAIHYCGSPLPLDFAETHAGQVNIVDIEPGLPPKITPAKTDGYRRMVTIEGEAADLDGLIDALPAGDPWVRLKLSGEVPPGTVDTARDKIGDRLVKIEMTDRISPRRRRTGDPTPRLGRALTDLFDEYMAEQGITHKGIADTFQELHEEAISATG